jgi:flagellar basal body-associated protein FliL
MKRKILSVLLMVFILAAFAAPTVFAENGDQVEGPPAETPVEQPTEPVEQPTAPAEQPTAPVEQPTEPPPEAPTQAPADTPAPTEEAGSVDLAIYVYDNGAAAEGYTVQIDQTKQVTDSAGKVSFPSLTVEKHDISVTSKDGKQSSGLLYMSRGGSTAVTDQAMGGTYGVDVARGAGNLYMVVDFSPGAALQIESLTDTQPSLPSPSSGATQTSGGSLSTENVEDKKVTASFVDEKGDAVSGLDVVFGIEGGPQATLTTNSKGIINVPAFAYGTIKLSFNDMDTLTLNMRKGVQTSLVGSDGNTYDISVAAGAKNLYLGFERSGGSFVLKEVSEEAQAGMSPVLLGIIVVVIVVVVVIVIVAARRNSRRKYYERSESPVGPQPRRTGGANKFDDRSRM